MPTEEKLVRITALLFRKEGTTPEKFYHHWYEIHGPKMLDLSLRYGVLEYRQVISLVRTTYWLSLHQIMFVVSYHPSGKIHIGRSGKSLWKGMPFV